MHNKNGCILIAATLLLVTGTAAQAQQPGRFLFSRETAFSHSFNAKQILKGSRAFFPVAQNGLVPRAPQPGNLKADIGSIPRKGASLALPFTGTINSITATQVTSLNKQRLRKSKLQELTDQLPLFVSPPRLAPAN